MPDADDLAYQEALTQAGMAYAAVCEPAVRTYREAVAIPQEIANKVSQVAEALHKTRIATADEEYTRASFLATRRYDKTCRRLANRHDKLVMIAHECYVEAVSPAKKTLDIARNAASANLYRTTQPAWDKYEAAVAAAKAKYLAAKET